jgi:hypothetical protein
MGYKEFISDQVVEYKGELFSVEADTEAYLILWNKEKVERVQHWDRNDVKVREDVKATFETIRCFRYPVFNKGGQ